MPRPAPQSFILRKFFLDPGSRLTQGYVELTSSGPRLAGSVVFGDPGRSAFSSSLPLISTLRTAMIFSQVASNLTYFTGLAILNPKSSEARVVIEVFSQNGAFLASQTELLQARRRRSQLLTQYLPSLSGRY